MKLLYTFIFFASLTLKLNAQAKSGSHIIQIVFTSDAHYGITRKTFRGQADVSGHAVNAAMIKDINTLPSVALPADGGAAAGEIIGGIDYVVEGGDIANRMEIPGQTAAQSWAQFDSDYIKGITVKNHTGSPATLLIVPGNHDISNAIGFYRPMIRPVDASSMANIYNLMMHPRTKLSASTFDYAKDRIHYSKNIGGIHCMFLNLWPDSLERIWMKRDLAHVPAYTPVFIFTHDQPECEAKHFINPNGNHSINAHDRFENLAGEQYKDGHDAPQDTSSTDIEQCGWVAFLKQHPNIKAYFHGNANFSQFYTYSGPDNNLALNIFRADSPMKGKYSSKDETKLSFMLITIDTEKGIMTARECLWNTSPAQPVNPVQWGTSKTMSYR